MAGVAVLLCKRVVATTSPQHNGGTRPDRPCKNAWHATSDQQHLQPTSGTHHRGRLCSRSTTTIIRTFGLSRLLGSMIETSACCNTPDLFCTTPSRLWGTRALCQSPKIAMAQESLPMRHGFAHNMTATRPTWGLFGMHKSTAGAANVNVMVDLGVGTRHVGGRIGYSATQELH